MEPIRFKEVNAIFAKDRSKYKPLPAYSDQSEQGQVISCWKLSLWERIYILFTGKLWVSLMMFGKPLTPSFFTVKKSEVLRVEKYTWKKILVDITNYTLRAYQIEGKQQVSDAFKNGSQAVVFCMPTGAGKTVVLADMAKCAIEKK